MHQPDEAAADQRRRPDSVNCESRRRALRPGYLRKNGVPYSADAVLTEHFVRLVDRGGQEYLAVTTMVDDPQYLQQAYVKTYEFKKQPNAAGWNPVPCSAK